MAEISLNVQTRELGNKGSVRRLRADKKIPGVYYFHGKGNIPIYVERTDLQAIWGHESALLDVSFDGNKRKKCIILDIQYDPIKGTPIHLDLMGIKMGEKFTVTVPLHLKGTPTGVKNGGIMQQMMRELQIECMPSDMPEFLEVDVTELEIGDSISISDVNWENIALLDDHDTTIVSITVPRMEEEPEEEEGEELEGEEGAEPEVIGQKAEGEEEEPEE